MKNEHTKGVIYKSYYGWNGPVLVAIDQKGGVQHGDI